MPDAVYIEFLRGVVENLDHEREDLQLWRAEYRDLACIADTKAGALRALADELELCERLTRGFGTRTGVDASDPSDGRDLKTALDEEGDA